MTLKVTALAILLIWSPLQAGMLQKRAYLARFLIDVEIPAELLLEEDMNLLHAQYNGVREQFKATHRHLDTLRQIEKDPNQVKERVQELETERDHLHSKIAKVKGKLQVCLTDSPEIELFRAFSTQTSLILFNDKRLLMTLSHLSHQNIMYC